MGYLRGSNKTKTVTTVPSQDFLFKQKFAALSRQVARNTPKPSHIRSSTSVVSTGAAGYQREDIDLTSLITGRADYDQLVTGDFFRNNSLHLRLMCDDAVKEIRVYVYCPDNPQVTFVPAPGLAGMTANQDQNGLWVLHDKVYGQQDIGVGIHMNKKINLRGKHTIYNIDSSVLEKGRFRMILMINHSTVAVGATLLSLSFDHSITDK